VSALTDAHRKSIWRHEAIRTLNDFNYELVSDDSELSKIMDIVGEARRAYIAAKEAKTRRAGP